ncbi:MAG: FISUMP domain-containing protein [Bacteroidota bacterium]
MTLLPPAITGYRLLCPVLCMGLLVLFGHPASAQTGTPSGASPNPSTGAVPESSRPSEVPPLPSMQDRQNPIPSYPTTLNDGEFLEQFSEEENPSLPMNQHRVEPMHRGVVDDDFIEQFSEREESDSLLTDMDGNRYPVVRIGEQIWMAENLRVTRFRDGTEIPELDDGTAWRETDGPALSWRPDEAEGDPVTGAYYNGAVIQSGQLCPAGWQVPGSEQWEELFDYVNDDVAPIMSCGREGEGEEDCVNPVRRVGEGVRWKRNVAPQGTNETGFNGEPTGFRTSTGQFTHTGELAAWWSRDQDGAPNPDTGATLSEEVIPGYRGISYNYVYPLRHAVRPQAGFHVRCMREASEASADRQESVSSGDSSESEADDDEPVTPDWETTIRPDHPRLFFNEESEAAVMERARTTEREWLETIEKRALDLRERLQADPSHEPEDLGQEAAIAAFLFRVTGDESWKEDAIAWLETSIDHYEERLRQRREVKWDTATRVHAVMAWDWLREEMDESRSNRLLRRLIHYTHGAITHVDEIAREHLGSPTTGYYGLRNLEWFLGLTAWGTGVEPEITRQFLETSYGMTQDLLKHRKNASGDDGGGASSTITYTFGQYPFAEQNYLYTWQSATGVDDAPRWPHIAMLANYVYWNWIEQEDGPPLEYGYGDVRHLTNELPVNRMYTHLANIRHLYGQAEPEAAALAGYLQERLPEQAKRWDPYFFVYPFLMQDLEQAPPPREPESSPLARHFENMGQVFFRTGFGPEETYALFAAGAALGQHKHYDNLHFIIVHKGYLALDSGTRYRQFVNGHHLANYYGQTVAHNTLLIHQPGEPASNYWGAPNEAAHGGQHQTLGSDVIAFESAEDWAYVAADATSSYHHGEDTLGEKADEVTRQFLFLAPDLFVIYDRVASTDAAYQKQWLLHTAREPRIEGNRFVAEHGEGTLTGRTVWPADATMRAVGGPGREFLAGGRNWEIDRGRLSEELELFGWGRIEVEPGQAQQKDHFLHVLQVGDRGESSTTEAMVEQIGNETRPGVRIRETDGTVWEIQFEREGSLRGTLRRTGGGKSDIERALPETIEPQTEIENNQP